MRRGSFIGPILLILIGGAFLLHNLRADWNVLEFLSSYWPALLILWGVLRIVEVTWWKASGKPLPRYGISGGEWAFIVFLFLVGNGLFLAHRYSDRFPSSRIHMRGLEIFGESFDFPLEDKNVEAGKTPRIVLEKFTGNARIHGDAGTGLRITGRTNVRAFTRPEAERANSQCRFELVQQGDAWIVRTNQDRASGNHRISAELDLTVPRGSVIEARGRYGDFDIDSIDGNIAIDSDNAGVRVSNIGGSVSVETRRSDIIRAVNVAGNVELRGSGWDIELDGIQGQAIVNGNYTGDILFRRLAKPLRFDSPSTELRVEKAGGQITMSRGEFSGSGIAGPIRIKSKSKDVELYDFQGPAEVAVERGDIEIRPVAQLGGKIDLRTRAGDIHLSLPEKAGFALTAETRRGEIESDWDTRASKEGRRQTLAIKSGAGPEVVALTDRGTVVVRKGSGAWEGPVEAPAPGDPAKPPAPPKPPNPNRGAVEEL
ncbi:MAG: DUF4097 family beta strand repeat-containing protein [Bryobacteraceae bacterium]